MLPPENRHRRHQGSHCQELDLDLLGHPLQTDSGRHRLENPPQPLTFDLHVALAAGVLAHVALAAGALVDVEEAARALVDVEQAVGSSLVEQHHADRGEAPMQKGSLVPHLPFRFWPPTPV